MHWDHILVALMVGFILGGLGKEALEALGRHLIEKYSEEVPVTVLPVEILRELRGNQ